MRSSTIGADRLLRSAFAPWWVPGVDAPANLSLKLDLGDTSARPGGTAPLHLLYRSSQSVVRSRRPRRAVGALASYLAALGAAPDGLLLSTAAAVIRGGQAVLLPRRVLARLEVVLPRLHRHGWQVVDSPTSAIDPATGALVVPPPLAVGDEAQALLARFDASGTPDREPPSVTPGSYPVVGWVFLTRAEDADGLTRAGAVAAALRSIGASPIGPGPTLHGLVRVFQAAAPLRLVTDGTRDLTDALIDALVAGEPVPQNVVRIP